MLRRKRFYKKRKCRVDKQRVFCYNLPCVCGRSSSGRARPCQGRGSEFEPRRPLQKETPSVRMVFLFGMSRAGANTLPRPARSALNQEVRQGSCEWLCHSWDAGSESRHVMRTSPHGRESICLLWRLPRSSKPVDWRATIESLPTSTAQCWWEHIANTASNSLHGIGTMTAQTWLSDGEIPVRLKSGIEKSRVFAEILFWLHLITLFFGSGVLYSKDNNS